MGRFFSRLLIGVLKVITLEGLVSWDKLPRLLGVVRLLIYRSVLRQENLYDTSEGMKVEDRERPENYRTARTPGGRYNDLDKPIMGSEGTRFGRNFPLPRVYPEQGEAFLTPSPRQVSLELMTRKDFIPATTVNVLAAAWIQFMTHTWFSHGDTTGQPEIEIPLKEDDPWPEKPMRVESTPKDPTRTPASEHLPPTFINHVTHWWDASQIYGSTAAEVAALRTGTDGKLVIGDDGLLLLDEKKGLDKTGFNNNYWIGLSLLHTLFTLEHNAICDRFRAEYPTWSDDEIYDHARLVNSALMAKIHTIEWTPAIISHPTTKFVMRASWWGILGERFFKLFGRIGGNDYLSGYPGSRKDHYGVDFTLTEEFVSVYRLHCLLPDDFDFRSAANDGPIKKANLLEIAGRNTRGLEESIPMSDLLYSLCTSYAGAMRLHNFPKSLQQFHEQEDSDLIDLAVVDILRDRERGVPRYNDFRELIHRERVKTFEELTGGNQADADLLKKVYNNDIDRVDLQIGMLAEPLPRGFGFSDTAFRIFILMAGRRLTSDRFFTDDYTREIYTKAGLDWIKDNGMNSVILRHYPQLAASLRGVKNAFAPWQDPVSRR